VSRYGQPAIPASKYPLALPPVFVSIAHIGSCGWFDQSVFEPVVNAFA
jgi:hypothetical protein